MATLTAFGRAVRKLRIDKGETLKQMADTLKISPTFISAIETGRKPAPEDVLTKIAKHFKLDEGQVDELRRTAESSRKEVRISLNNAGSQAREVVSAFARRFDELDANEIKRLKEILVK